ncbi:MAG: PIN domain-containing protein [Acidobacteria bacterium]|nr:PIN domain-containing protein [Acidobacteriota bacterium]
MIHLDTHVVAWLYAGDLRRFPQPVIDLLDAEELQVSPMVLLELQYLHEIGRASDPAETVFRGLEREIGLKICDRPFPEVILSALGRSWTRDPFDRLIASQAEVAGVSLLTKDQSLLAHEAHALWG